MQSASHAPQCSSPAATCRTLHVRGLKKLSSVRSSVCSTLKLKVMMLRARNFSAAVGDFGTSHLQAPTVKVQAVEPPARRMPASVKTLGMAWHGKAWHACVFLPVHMFLSFFRQGYGEGCCPLSLSLSLSLSTGREGRDSIQAAPLMRTRTPAVLGGTTPSPQRIFH